MMFNAQGAKREPLKFKRAKSQLFTRPPSAARPTVGFAQPAGSGGATHASRIPASPLAGGYCSARFARLSQGTPIHAFHAKNLP
jgi:hypothetical protein